MFSRLKRLAHFEARARGARISAQIDGHGPAVVHVDATPCAPDEQPLLLGVLDGLARALPRAQLSLQGFGDLEALLRSHLGPTTPPQRSGVTLRVTADSRANVPAELTDALTLRLGPSGGDDGVGELTHRRWLRTPLHAGLSEHVAPPRLRIKPGAGRRWLRRMTGVWRGPLIAVVGRSPDAVDRYAAVAEGLRRSLGATTLQLSGPAVPGCAAVAVPAQADVLAAVLPGCALCIGDDLRWVYLAATLGVPALALHPHPAAKRDEPRPHPALEPIAWHAGRSARYALARLRYATDDNVPNMLALAEQLAVLSWPRDRIYRLLP